MPAAPTHAPSWRNNVYAATIATFIGFMGFTLVMPFLPLYFRQLGVTDVGRIALWSGLSLGVTPAVTAALSPLWGRLGDRFGMKIMVERSLLSFVLVMTALAYVTEAWHVLALRTIQGLFAGYGALTLTIAAQAAPKDRLPWAIGLVQTAQRLGPAIGPVVGGTIAPLVGLRRAFIVAAAFYVVAIVLMEVLYREPTTAGAAAEADPAAMPRRARGARGPGERVTLRSVLAFQNFVVLMATVFGLQFVDRSFGPILPLVVAELGTPLPDVPLVAGLLFSAAAACAALGNNLTAKLLGRFSARSLIVGCAVAAAAASTAFAGAQRVLMLAIAVPIFGLSTGIGMTAAYTAAGAAIPRTAQGAGFGTLTSASLTGLAVSPVISGLLGAWSLRAVFVLNAVVLGALAALVARTMSDAPVTGPPPVVEEPSA